MMVLEVKNVQYFLIKVQNHLYSADSGLFSLPYDTNLILKPVICPLLLHGGLGTSGRRHC